jgi:hypothetical protein
MAWYWWTLLVGGSWTAEAALLSPAVGRWLVRSAERGTRRPG